MTERPYNPGVFWDDSRGCYNVDRDGPYRNGNERAEARRARYWTLEDEAAKQVADERNRQISIEIQERAAAARIAYSAWIWERAWWEWVWLAERAALSADCSALPFGDPRFLVLQNQILKLKRKILREELE